MYRLTVVTAKELQKKQPTKWEKIFANDNGLIRD